MKNWKTSILGIILIIVGIGMYISQKDFTQPLVCITTGLGLLAAKDFDKTGTK